MNHILHDQEMVSDYSIKIVEIILTDLTGWRYSLQFAASRDAYHHRTWPQRKDKAGTPSTRFRNRRLLQ